MPFRQSGVALNMGAGQQLVLNGNDILITSLKAQDETVFDAESKNNAGFNWLVSAMCEVQAFQHKDKEMYVV